MNSNNINENTPKKGVWKGIGSGMYTAYAHTKTGSKNTQQAVKIQLTEKKIIACKHKFGSDYLDLLIEQNASEQELAACVETAKDEIERLKGKLAKYQDIIAYNKDKMESKIAKRKGEPPQHSQPSFVINDASQYSDSTSEAASSFTGMNLNTSSPFPEAASASLSPSPSAQPEPSAPPEPTNVYNPFDDESDDGIPSAALSASSFQSPSTVPTATAVPVSATNNPFDDDSDDGDAVNTNSNPFDEKMPATTARSSSINPFDDGS